MDINDLLSDKTQPVGSKVKIAILYNDNSATLDPNTVPSSKMMSDYGFDPGDIIDLTDLFNIIVDALKPTAPDMSSAAVQGATKVQDCIDLVSAQIK